MTDMRKPVIAALVGLVSLMLLLWFIRGPRPIWPSLAFFAISTLLVPLAALGLYGILYLVVRENQMSSRALRAACGVLFVAAVVFLAWSTMSGVRRFATHRTIPPPNLLALGVALGAIKAWGLREKTVPRR